jgi:hypothetical protein
MGGMRAVVARHAVPRDAHGASARAGGAFRARAAGDAQGMHGTVRGAADRGLPRLGGGASAEAGGHQARRATAAAARR